MSIKSIFATTFFFIVLNFSFAQESQCPTSVGYSTTACVPYQPPGFYMFSAPYAPGNETVIFDFDNPGCDGSHVFTHILCFGNKMMDITPPICMDEHPTGTITFPSRNLTCHYTNGENDGEFQTDCLNLINDCKEPLIEFAKDLIPDPANCKLWEGPCTIESEIWRSGKVNIGSVVSLDGYKLGVRGGITTELLQICKPEWCDYVFSDTFYLRPLEEVNHYIQQKGRLPNTTSAQEIIRDGGFLLDVETVHQQEKIEEIFLHLIEAQHRLDHLDKKLSTTSNFVDSTSSILPYAGEEYPKEVLDQIQIECFQIKVAPNGIGGVIITDGNGPYNLSWSGPSSGSMNNVSCSSGAIQIQQLAAGTYNISVSNASGLLGTCSFSILSGGNPSTCDIFSDPGCKEVILEMLENEAFGMPPNCIQWEGDPCSHEDEIYHLGNVGIGTSVGRAGFSLAVKGGIVTNKFRVELCESNQWCDYVFDQEYPLLSLLDVESYIKKHKHLPGAITQNEVTENGGFEMRNVKIDHQKKIEEAYLHLIALNKKQEVLKQKLNHTIENN